MIILGEIVRPSGNGKAAAVATADAETDLQVKVFQDSLVLSAM